MEKKKPTKRKRKIKKLPKRKKTKKKDNLTAKQLQRNKAKRTHHAQDRKKRALCREAERKKNE